MQTQTTIRELLESAGLRPTKRFGQHFLVDGNLMRKLVASAELRADDVVLEVGCGTASLTQELAPHVGRVITVEVDRGLAGVATNQLADLPNVTLLHCDALLGKHQVHPDVLSALSNARDQMGGRILLVANLPYQIASPLVIDLLTGPVDIAAMCFTVQKEVALRLDAAPGHGDYGPLAIIVQALADTRRIANVPPQAFWPVPAVDSAMVRLDPNGQRQAQIADIARFAALVRACFLHRRKTLAYNLSAATGAKSVQSMLDPLGIPPTTRPERVTVSQWIALANTIPHLAEHNDEP